MSVSFVRRTALAAAALPLLLAGCTEDEPVPQFPDPTTPTRSPSATETTAAPEPWEDKSEEGAIAFARHWVDLLNDARMNDNFTPLRAASTQSCNTCASFLDILEQLSQPGALYESKPWTIKQATSIGKPMGRQAKVVFRVHSPAERVKEVGDETVREHAATTDTYEATLRWAGSTWQMHQLVIVK